MKNTLLIIIMLCSFLSFGQNNESKSPKIVIKIALDEEVKIENHSIKFLNVLEDSRCPTGANCIWAGRAKLLIEITSAENEKSQKEIIFGKANPGESSDLVLFSNEDEKIMAYQLKPYPNTGEQIKTVDYILLISIEN